MDYVIARLASEWAEIRDWFATIVEEYRTRDICGFDLVTAIPPRGRLAPRTVYRQAERKARQ